MWRWYSANIGVKLTSWRYSINASAAPFQKAFIANQWKKIRHLITWRNSLKNSSATVFSCVYSASILSQYCFGDVAVSGAFAFANDLSKESNSFASATANEWNLTYFADKRILSSSVFFKYSQWPVIISNFCRISSLVFDGKRDNTWGGTDSVISITSELRT